MIGNKIKKIRELRNYTQEFVANRLGISQNAYSKIETNQTRVTTGRLKELSELLNVPDYELLKSDSDIFNFNNNQIQNAYVNNLYENQKDLYENVITHLKDEIAHLRQEKNKLLELIKSQKQ
ncbi:MAG: helix-turn-helix domain-containing protein [Bacteroidota bacterium]